MAGSTVWAHPTPPKLDGQLLMEKMGGVEKIAEFIDGFYDRLLADKEVAGLLLKSQMAQKQEVYMKLLKDRSVEYLETVWGGDTYEGQDLFKAHAHLHINSKAYDRSVKIALTTVKAMKLSSQVSQAIMDEMEVMRAPITDADGKFHKWVADKQKEAEDKFLAEGAVDLTGMGFTSSPALVKDLADKAKRKEELKARMEAFKAQKKQEAKEAKKKAANGEPASPTSPTSAKSADKKNKGADNSPKKPDSPKKAVAKKVVAKKTAEGEEHGAKEHDSSGTATTATPADSDSSFMTLPDVPENKTENEAEAWLPETPAIKQMLAPLAAPMVSASA